MTKEEFDDLCRQSQHCTRCRLAAGRTKVVFGVGSTDADVMFVGEAPGFYEDRAGEPFVGAAGQLLDRVLDGALNVQRSGVYITNVVKCRPPNNRDPQPDEADACRMFLDAQLAFVAPRVLCTLGNVATRAILGRTVSIGTVRGRTFTIGDRTVIPTYHPAAILRNANLYDIFFKDIEGLTTVIAQDRPTQPEQKSLF